MSNLAKNNQTPQAAPGADLIPNAVTVLNITASTVVKAVPGRLARISVIVAGSTVGSANDCVTTAAAVTANEVAAIPNAVGVYPVDFPCMNGITIVPGTGQTVAVAFY